MFMNELIQQMFLEHLLRPGYSYKTEEERADAVPACTEIYLEGQAAGQVLTKECSVIRSEVEKEEGMQRIYLNRGFKVPVTVGAFNPSS